jgi:hypothetical protein
MQIPSSPIRPLLKKFIVRGLDAVDARAAVRRAISKNGEELVIGRRRLCSGLGKLQPQWRKR